MASGEKVLKAADLAYENALDIFEVPASNLGVADVRYITHRPVNHFNTEGNVKFRVPGSGSAYIDMREIYLKTTVKITKDGKDVPAKPQTATATTTDEGDWSIGVVNNLAGSLWHSVELRLNDVVVLGGQTGYAYGAILNTLLDENDYTAEELECAMFHKDTAFKMNSFSILKGDNEGFKTRATMLAESKSVELLAKLDVDFFKAKKYLINSVNLDINLVPTSSAFRLLTANTTITDYSLEIEDIALVVKQVVPSPQVLVAHAEIMKKELSRARYFYLKEDIRKFGISKGTSSYYIEDGFQGSIPNTLAIAFVAGDALTGHKNKNPFSFNNYNITSISVSLTGSPTARGPISLDFTKGKYIQTYADLYGGKTKKNVGGQRITLKEFPGGYSIFVIHLNPQTKDSYYPTARDGSVRIEIRFGTQLPESVVMLTRVTYPAQVEIDYQRNVYLQ